MSDTKIQWHPGFVAAMGLELREYRKVLVFEKEYNLNTRPLEIDLLIIKKGAAVHISNDIGSFFRGHNIKEMHTWLNALSGKLCREDIQDLLDKIKWMTEKDV